MFPDLDDLAVLEATDKSSLEHDYARHYAAAFDQFKDQQIDFLEIGVADGASLRMWEKYFSRARLIGVDIIEGCAQYAGGRKIVEIGSQAEPQFLNSLAEKYSPTIIIDDGSHLAPHIEASLRHLFPILKDGGCYVIEDLHFHVSTEGPAQPTGGLKLALDIAFLATRAHLMDADRSDWTQYLLKRVDRVEFVKHAAFIWKKWPDQDEAGTLARMKELVEQSQSHRNLIFFTHYILNHGGSLSEAEAAAQSAIALGDRSGLAYWRLSEVLERQGDVKGAFSAAESALKTAPSLTAVKARIERLKAVLEGDSSLNAGL